MGRGVEKVVWDEETNGIAFFLASNAFFLQSIELLVSLIFHHSFTDIPPFDLGLFKPNFISVVTMTPLYPKFAP